MITFHVVADLDDGPPAFDVYQGDSMVAAALVPKSGTISFRASTSNVRIVGYTPMSVVSIPEEVRHPPLEKKSIMKSIIEWFKSLFTGFRRK